jgi:hypothetical protein
MKVFGPFEGVCENGVIDTVIPTEAGIPVPFVTAICWCYYD